jgi:hypothetical protein
LRAFRRRRSVHLVAGQQAFPQARRVLVTLAAAATAIDAFGPLALSHLINAVRGLQASI